MHAVLLFPIFLRRVIVPSGYSILDIGEVSQMEGDEVMMQDLCLIWILGVAQGSIMRHTHAGDSRNAWSFDVYVTVRYSGWRRRLPGEWIDIRGRSSL